LLEKRLPVEIGAINRFPYIPLEITVRKEVPA
jgi:hypothetical protein